MSSVTESFDTGVAYSLSCNTRDGERCRDIRKCTIVLDVWWTWGLSRNSRLFKNFRWPSTTSQRQRHEPFPQGAYYANVMDIHGRLLYLMVGIDKEEEVRSKRCLWLEGEKRERIHQDGISCINISSLLKTCPSLFSLNQSSDLE